MKGINSAISKVSSGEELSEKELYPWLVKYEHILKATEAFSTLNTNGSNASEVVEIVDGHFSIMADGTVANPKTKGNRWTAFKKCHKDHPSYRFIKIEREKIRQIAVDLRVIELKKKQEGRPKTMDFSAFCNFHL